jgi:hypothetical protein
MLQQKKIWAKFCQKVTQIFENKMFCCKFPFLRIHLKVTKFWVFLERMMPIGYSFKSS